MTTSRLTAYTLICTLALDEKLVATMPDVQFKNLSLCWTKLS